MKKRKIVYICSPLRGDLQRNITRANYFSRFAYEKGCIPIAPHTIFPQFLNDEDPKERKAGMEMGLALLDRCEEVWVFGPHISDGMRAEIERARKENKRTRYFSESLEET